MTATTTRRFLIAACALACVAIAPQAEAGDWSWGKSEQVQGNGHVQRQARDVAHFSGLAMSLPGNVEIKSGSAREGVTVEADDNLLPLIETVVDNGILKIRQTKRNLDIDGRHLKIVVQAKGVDHLTLGGSGSIDADALRGPKVNIDLGGSGSINVRGVDSEALSVVLGGSGDLKVGAGTTKKLSLSIAGSGNVDLGKLQSTDASVNIAGSGEATISVRDNLNVTIAGSGDVNYYGDPRVSKTSLGSGSAKRLGAAR
jgi:hypothetical protein